MFRLLVRSAANARKGLANETLLDYRAAPRDSLALLVQKPSAGCSVAEPLGLGRRVPGDTRMSDDIRDKIGLEEQWVEREGKVYRRWRFIGDEPWGEWELTSHPRIPFIIQDFSNNHNNVQRAITGED